MLRNFHRNVLILVNAHINRSIPSQIPVYVELILSRAGRRQDGLSPERRRCPEDQPQMGGGVIFSQMFSLSASDDHSFNHLY